MNYKTPKTHYSMRGDLLNLDEKIRQYWKENNIMQKYFEYDSNKQTKLLICGPPYANGDLHTGHKINFILKDIFTHFWRSNEYNVSHLVGFDCHGRPIEQKINPTINANSNENDIQKHINSCRELAITNINRQYLQLQNLNIFIQNVNGHKYYATLNEYVSIYEAFSHLLLNNYVYAEQRPMLWSMSDESVISEIETEYKTKISTSIYVALNIQNTHEYIVIWTTTPWTLIDNAAVCYNHQLKYKAIVYKNKKYIICADLIDLFLKKTQWNAYIVEDYIINENILIQHPILNKFVNLYHGDHVTNSMGTGFVHTAPAHGIEDFEIYLKQKTIRPFTFTESVGSNGVYFSHIEKVANLHIFNDENQILNIIHDKLLYTEKYEHNYLFAQRSKEPIIYRASNQIFANLHTLNFENVKNVHTTPKSLSTGLYEYVKERKEWCLSRNRTWGVPLAIVIDKITNKIYINEQFQKEIIKQMAVDAYMFLYKSKFENFCRQHIANFDEKYQVYLGVLDVWFDSACAYDIVTNLLKMQNIPSTFIEGVDQKRGWFQSSLLARLLQKKSLPFNEILSHGFVVDANRLKLSKSLGNAAVVNDLIAKHGVEILRIRMMLCDFTSEIIIGEEVMNDSANTYRKIRNVLRYLISVCETYEFTGDKNFVIQDDINKIYYNQFVIFMHEFRQKMHDANGMYNFSEAFNLLISFITNISSNYFNACKKNLYENSDIENQSILYVMNHMLIGLLHCLKPILPITCEEIFIYIKTCKLNSLWNNILSNVSIHLCKLYEYNQTTITTNDIYQIEQYEIICNEISKELALNNITTGYEKDYTMTLYMSNLYDKITKKSIISSTCLQMRFGLKSVVFEQPHDIEFITFKK